MIAGVLVVGYGKEWYGICECEKFACGSGEKTGVLVGICNEWKKEIYWSLERRKMYL